MRTTLPSTVRRMSAERVSIAVAGTPINRVSRHHTSMCDGSSSACVE